MNLIPEVKTMSSREIAELVETRHDSVKRSIERLAKTGVISFTPTVEPTPGGGKPTSVLSVNERDSYVIVAQLSPQFTGRLVDRWQELEKQQAPALPQTFSEALQLAADQAKQLEEQAPKVEFVDKYVASDTGNKGFRQVAKLLKVKENWFREYLVQNKIMYKLDGEWVPYQNHTDAGRFEVKAGTKNNHAYNTAKFTPKGVQWIAELIGK